MFNEPLNKMLGSPAKVAVLRALSLVNSPMTGRAVERAARVAHAACLRALDELSLAGVVTSKQYGREKLYELNRKSVLVAEGLMPLFKSERLRREMLFAEIKRWLKKTGPRVIHASVYGSIARDEDRLESDLDLLLVVGGDREKENLLERWLEIESSINDKFSVRVSPYILTFKEFNRRYKLGDKLIESVIRDGFTIFGKQLTEL